MYGEVFFFIMAYRFRRSFGRRFRRRRTPVSRFYRYRSSRRNFYGGRRRSFGRYRRVRRRGPINRVSPFDHKKDTLVGGHNTSNTTFVPIAVTDAEPNMFLGFCPTWLPHNTGAATTVGPATRHRRGQPTIFFKGYRENVNLTVQSSVIWRRVVLWSYRRVVEMQPPLKGTAPAAYHVRQLTPISNTVAFRTWLFAGTQGIDYTVQTLHQAALNTTNFVVQSDKTRTINWNVDATVDFKYYEKKFWNPGGKIVYPYDEQGETTSLGAGGFSANSRESKGNMYIIDIFSAPGTNGTVGNFSPQGTRYWKEG